jgi:hypothetical protein
LKRILIILAALIFGLIGLGMSLCGGGFLVAGLLDSIQRKSTENMGFVAMALPALLIGIGLTVVCFKALLKQSDDRPPDETNRS